MSFVTVKEAHQQHKSQLGHALEDVVLLFLGAHIAPSFDRATAPTLPSAILERATKFLHMALVLLVFTDG